MSDGRKAIAAGVVGVPEGSDFGLFPAVKTNRRGRLTNDTCVRRRDVVLSAVWLQ